MSHCFKAGWKPDVPDFRDFRMSVAPDAAALPSKVDLRAGMPPVWDQGQLGSCHDPETEVLTDSGWVKFVDLTGNERLASVDPVSKKLIFELPTRLIAMRYSGPMYYGKHQNLDFAVTADHKMLVRKWNEAKRMLEDHYDLVSMKEVGWYAGFLNEVRYDGEFSSDHVRLKGVSSKRKSQREDISVPMELWLQFLGIYIAEGTMLKSYVKTRVSKHGVVGTVERGANKVQIAASKEREKAFVRHVLTGLGIKFHELKDRFTFQNKRVFSALKSLDLFGVKAPQKFVPEFVFKLPSYQIKHFLDGHFAGDGCEQNGVRSHYTSSRCLADGLQRLIFLSGSWSNLRVRAPREGRMTDGRKVIGKHPEHRVSVWTTGSLSLDRAEHVEVKQYDGMVYCAEVPTYHTLVTRRNNQILISGNCTAHAIGAIVEFIQKRDKPVWDFMPSRLFIYYNERLMEGTIQEDSGAYIRDGIKSVNKYGVCREDLWPYDIAKFTKKPTAKAYKNALVHQALKYQRVPQTLVGIKTALSAGLPFVFGFAVYDSFESYEVARTGIVPMPKANESLLGGHAVCAVGYDDATQMVLVRNSWGTGWGVGGYFWMPYAYLLNSDLADDLWLISKMES